jgi:predicted nucleic acid-binding protein
VGLTERLGPGPVAVDTAVFIYFIEEHPAFLPDVAPLFAEADRGARELVTSSLTLLELLVIPYRTGNRLLAERYEALLTRSRGIRLVDITRAHLHAAAQLRAATKIRTPDALQLAAAIEHRCASFVTNDRRLPPIPGVRIIDLGSKM